MGYWYWRQLFNEKVLDENTTNRMDLPEKGYLSGLMLGLQMTNLVGNYALDDKWPFQQTTLKVVGNGNKELINLRGRQLEALNFWDTGKIPKNILWDDIGGGSMAYAYIPFGRYMGDPKYGLILDKFSAGVQLVDENTVSTTYFTDGSVKLDVLALMRKDPEPGMFSGGYLAKRLIKTKDAASEVQYGVKLPTVNKLRNIHLFTEPTLTSHLPATTPFTLLNKTWLGIKSREEYIINNVSASLFARTIYEKMNRKAHTSCMSKVHATNANYADTQIYEREGTHVTALHTSAAYAIENSATFWERIARVYAFVTGGTGTSLYVYVDAWGILYHGLLPLLDVDPMADETEFLDAKAMADVYVEFTETSGSGNIYVVLDELEKSYPS